MHTYTSRLPKNCCWTSPILSSGGKLDLPAGAPLELRVFIDGSAVEIFTGTGQVLSTRCVLPATHLVLPHYNGSSQCSARASMV